MTDLSYREEPPTCGEEWTNGWGQHTCDRPWPHQGPHRCECDAERHRSTTDGILR